MDEIQNPPPEINVRSVNFKTNINVNSKTQAVQSVNFQEILSKFGSQQSTQTLSNQGNNINLDSLQMLNQNPEEAGNTSNEGKLTSKNSTTSVKVSTEQDPHTTIFSQFNPQKTANIKDKSFNFLKKMPPEEKSQETNLIILEKNPEKKKIRPKPVTENELPTPKENSKKNASKSFYESDTYKDSYIRETKRSEVFNENNTGILKRELQVPLLIPPGHQQNFEDEQKKRRPKHQESENEAEKTNNEEVFIIEVNKIIDGYGFKKPTFNFSRGESKNEEYNEWLKSLIFGASNESLTINESEVLSKYIVKNEEITFTDKEILSKLLSEIFKHQVISLNSNLLTRLDKTAIELIYRAFPSVILNGFLKKTGAEIEKSRDKKMFSLTPGIYKLINGIKMSVEEVHELSDFFLDDFTQEEMKTLKNLFNGDYKKEDIEKIKVVITKMADKDYLPPGFIGCLYEILIERLNNDHPESVKQILKILETYVQGKDFSKNEAKTISTFFAKKYFSSTLIDNNKVRKIITQLVLGEKVDYLSLELLAKITNKSLLSYLPARLDPEIDYFLKYMPFTENEVKYQENFEEGSNSIPEFYFTGKIKVSGINKFARKDQINLTLLNCSTKKEIEIIPDKNFILKEKIEVGNYQLKNLKIISGKSIINVDLNNILVKNNDINFFNVDSPIDIFYFGTLKIFLDSENFSLQKIQLKNAYNSFLEYYKKVLKLSLKDKVIKINSKLYN